MIIILSLVVFMVDYVHQKIDTFLYLFSLNKFVCFRDNTLPGLKEDSKHPEMSERGKLKRKVTFCSFWMPSNKNIKFKDHG